MKKTAIAILIAVLVVAIGGALVFAGLSAIRFEFKKLDRSEYVTDTYSFGPVTRIDIQCDTADVELVAEGETGCKVTCFQTSREQYTVDAVDGTLIIRQQESASGWRFPLFSFKSPKITVSLPAGRYELLQAALHTGDITADKGLSFDEINVELDTGDLALAGVQADKVMVRGNTGDLRLSDMEAESVDISLRTGDITLSDLVCSGDLRAKSTTGDIRLANVDGANLYLSASTGDIKGTILTEKVFSAHATTGSVSVPNTTAGGRCQADTTTGSIHLSISGK